MNMNISVLSRVLRWYGVALLMMSSVFIHAQTYNIRDYGEVSDTNKVCTAAIQRAIDACHEAGGGQVLIPAGLYKSGTIILKDNVELHLSSGAQLVASADARISLSSPSRLTAAFRRARDGTRSSMPMEHATSALPDKASLTAEERAGEASRKAWQEIITSDLATSS